MKGGYSMTLTQRKWEAKRCELEENLYCLAATKISDPLQYEYKCQILAAIYNQTFGADHVEDFMTALTDNCLYELSIVLTREEYGDPV